MFLTLFSYYNIKHHFFNFQNLKKNLEKNIEQELFFKKYFLTLLFFVILLFFIFLFIKSSLFLSNNLLIGNPLYNTIQNSIFKKEFFEKDYNNHSFTLKEPVINFSLLKDKDFNQTIFYDLKKINDSFYFSNKTLFNNDYFFILIFIMEQTTYDNFFKELKDFRNKKDYNKDNDFFLKTFNNSLIFTNYYTTNQDSRTADWVLFNNFFIPSKSYLIDWNEEYGFILNITSLIDFFNNNNFLTISGAALENSLILKAHNWSGHFFLNDYERTKNNFICIDSIHYASGCEDNAVLNKVKKNILLAKKNNKSLFLVQEMIFGHGEDYMIKSGLSRTGYYNLYFNNIFNFLKKEKILNNSLIIITSDHGLKGFNVNKINYYKVPLIIYNPHFSQRNITSLNSHLSFGRILLRSIFLLNNLKQNYSEKNFNNLFSSINFSIINNSFLYGQTITNYVGLISNKGYVLLKYNNYTLMPIDTYNLSEDVLRKYFFKLFSFKKTISFLSKQNNYYCYFCD